jgi:hypothetical protein
VAELTETQLIAVVVAVVVVVLLAIVGTIQIGRARRRRMELRRRFGSEYARTVEEADRRRDAEDDLLEREERHRHVRLTGIPEARVAAHRERLEQLQATFVTAPVSAVRTVDGLLTEVAVARGYPDGAPDRILSDVSVDRPEAVAAHRRGQSLLVHAGTRHEPDTEQLRRAFVASRQLFEALVADATPPAAAPAAPAAEASDTSPAATARPGGPPPPDPGHGPSEEGSPRHAPEPVPPPPAVGDGMERTSASRAPR